MENTKGFRFSMFMYFIDFEFQNAFLTFLKMQGFFLRCFNIFNICEQISSTNHENRWKTLKDFNIEAFSNARCVLVCADPSLRGEEKRRRRRRRCRRKLPAARQRREGSAHTRTHRAFENAIIMKSLYVFHWFP